MTTIGWIILLILLVPAVGLLAWVVLSESFVRIPSGTLGLLLVRGRPTDTTLLPGRHFVPALRRRAVVAYPSVELSYRAGGSEGTADRLDLDRVGGRLQVFLGDQVQAAVGYTVRFRLRPTDLRLVHERFGPDGIFGLVRDESASIVSAALGRPGCGVEDLIGKRREVCRDAVAEELTAALQALGLEVTGFAFGEIDLGRTGEVIQAVSRAPYELARENATAELRNAQARNDAELTANGDPRRYRESELWRELIVRRETLNVALSSTPAAGLTPDGQPGAADARSTGSGERR